MVVQKITDMEFLNKKYGISGFTKNLYEISGLRFPIQGPLPRKLGMVILYTGTNNLKSNQNLSNIANGIISLAKNIKSSGTKASISLLIPLRDRLSEKEKKY